MFKDVFYKEPDERHSTADEEETAEEEPVQQEEEEYDPFAHRNVSKPTSDFGALAHILKTSFGSGILAMPMAFKYAGLITGTVGCVLLGALCTHCVKMLVWNSQNLCKKFRVPVLSFPETGEKAFLSGPKRLRRYSRFIGIVITVELLASFILGNTVYVVFVTHSMYQVIEHYWGLGVNLRLYSALLWIPLMLMCMLPNLKSLVPFSIMANIFVLISFGIILYYIFRNMKPVPSVNMVSPVECWPLFMSTFIFAIEGVGTVLSIEHEMKNPKHFLGRYIGILYIGMGIIVLVYGFIGFFGYLEFGEQTKGSIALNLPMKELLAQAVKGLIALAIFFTYALQFYVPINLIVRMIISRLEDKYHFYIKVGVRVGLVSLTIILAIAVPHLEPIISLVGAVCFAMLGLLFPAVIDSVSSYPDYGRLTGVYTSLLKIIEYYTNDEEEY